MSPRSPLRPLLLCFDGSENATLAIAEAGRLMLQRPAVVVTAWEPVATWEPYDPATILSAPIARLANDALGMDQLVRELAQDKAQRGLELAREAGFQATSRVIEGKTWRRICDVAEEIDAEAIVLGARGLSRVQSTLLGSVSSAVVTHAHRPVLVVPPHRGTG